MAEKDSKPASTTHAEKAKASGYGMGATVTAGELVTAAGLTPPASPPAVGAAPEDPAAFRRLAALEILGAYVSKFGGFGRDREEMDTHMRQVWQYADAFVALEDSPAPPPPAPESAAPPPRAKRRPVHPTDEWAVVDGERKHSGFQTVEEAEFFAAGRQGARIIQVAGPEIQQLVAADA